LLRFGGPAWRAADDASGVVHLSGHIDRFDDTPLDRRVAELAGRQWGVVSLEQLSSIGLSHEAVRSSTRSVTRR